MNQSTTHVWATIVFLNNGLASMVAEKEQFHWREYASPGIHEFVSLSKYVSNHEQKNEALYYIIEAF